MNIGFMVIRNGVRLGYPFVEAIASVLPVVDAFLVVDHHSDDGTTKILHEMRKLNAKIEVAQHDWPAKSGCGSAIAKATNNGKKLVIKRWSNINKLLYLQADEVYHENDQQHLSDVFRNKLDSTSFRFIHFRNGFDRYIANPSYDRAIRIIRKTARNIQDGFTFDNVGKTGHSQAIIYHVGWCFPKNICNKHINHCSLYPGVPSYEHAKKVCSRMLKTGKFSTAALCAQVDRHYKFVKLHNKYLPKVLRHLLKLPHYDGNQSLKVLSGVLSKA